jgi:molybdopterin converting factor small subunit
MSTARREPGKLQVPVLFHSYFKDLAGCGRALESLDPGATVADLLEKVWTRYPKLAAMRGSALVAVGVEYQKRDYILHDGDEVSLLPPVQGG